MLGKCALMTRREAWPLASREDLLPVSWYGQALTNDTFIVACHHITYSPTFKAGDGSIIPERFSVCYFAKSTAECLSSCPLQEFITEATPRHYEGTTAWEWNDSRTEKLSGAFKEKYGNYIRLLLIKLRNGRAVYSVSSKYFTLSSALVR